MEINHCQRWLVELFGQIRGEVSCVRLPEVTKQGINVVRNTEVSIGSRTTLRCARNRSPRSSEKEKKKKREREKKWTATSTVKPLIISLVSHKSTDRAAVT